MSKNNYSLILWISVAAAILLVGGGMYLIVAKTGQPFAAGSIPPVAADDYVRGPLDAKVTIVEYADFECPACMETYLQIMKPIESEYKDRILFVYRNLPIPGHLNGPAASRAAGAAALQGKFWEMADLLFTNQNKWSFEDAATFTKTLDTYALTLGLDLDKFRSDEASDVVRAKIEKDAQGGIKSGVNSTPTFFINGKEIKPVSYEQFKRDLDDALAKNK